jgi:stringent starvation protein B
MADPMSTKPYLLRAIYEWCVDNGYTPYLSVAVDAQTRVPVEHVRNGEIVLNIGPVAANRLRIGNDVIECTARFSGAARDLSIPVSAVAAIYAHENGHGMSFETAAREPPAEDSGSSVADKPKDPPKSGGKPALRRVK